MRVSTKRAYQRAAAPPHADQTEDLLEGSTKSDHRSTLTPRMRSHRVGIGFRPELAAGLLADPQRVDFLEVVAETTYARDEWRREALALAEVWPVVPHGVKLSLASADGIEVERARKLGALARELKAPFVSEHIALTRAGRRDLGHLTPVPFTMDAAKVVAKNVDRTRRELPDVPFLLENPAWTLRFRDDAMSEGDFYREIVARTGCGMLLDVANVYANAKNAGVDPVALLDSHPLEAVRMIHVAGGLFEDGFWFDTHAHDVGDEVMALVAHVVARCGDVPMVLERDGNFPDFASTARELDALRAIATGVSKDAPALSAPPLEEVAVDELVRAQADLAGALLDGAVHARFDARAIARTRAVLDEKRLDDALPLLPRLARRRAEIEPLVRGRVPSWPRPDEHVGPADALRIAELAAEHPALADDARLDRILLRARFVGPTADGTVRKRVAPYVVHETVGTTSVWALKGPGTLAPIRLWTRDDRNRPMRKPMKTAGRAA